MGNLSSQARLQILILAYSLGNFLGRSALPGAEHDWSFIGRLTAFVSDSTMALVADAPSVSPSSLEREIPAQRCPKYFDTETLTDVIPSEARILASSRVSPKQPPPQMLSRPDGSGHLTMTLH